MIQEIQDIHQAAIGHNTILGRMFLFLTGLLLVVAESLPNTGVPIQYMQWAQIFAWSGTGIAGLATAYFYLVKKKK